MPVPISISELSTTPGSNSPSGSDSPSVLDDHQRTAYAFIRTLSDNKLDASSAVLLTGNQTIAGTKTFSSNIVGNLTGNVSGTAASVSGTVAIANGGTGQTTAEAAFTAIKQAASETATGVVEIATTAEAQTGTDTTRALTVAGMVAAKIQSGTAVTLTTQTAVDFTAIPSWAKRVTVLVSGVSASGTSIPLVQLIVGGSPVVTGYRGSVQISATIANLSTGFLLATASLATSVLHGTMTLERVGTSNTWLCKSVMGRSDAPGVYQTGGSLPAAGAVEGIRFTTVNGTDQLDAGIVNISYE